jgi:hypothetical protein
MDSPSPSAANGLPYEFARYTSPGTVTDSNPLETGQITPIGGQLACTHRHELPLNLGLRIAVARSAGTDRP